MYNFSWWHLTWRSLKFWKTHGILLPSVYGSTLKYLTLTFCPNFFSWLPHTYSDSQKFFGTNTQCKIFHVGTLQEGHFNSEKPWESVVPSVYGSTLKNLTLTFCPNFFSWLPHMYFGTNTQCTIFHGGIICGGHLNSEKPVGFCYLACMGLLWKFNIDFLPQIFFLTSPHV